MKKMERESLYPNPNRGIKTKMLGLVFVLIGVLMFKANAHAFASNELGKCRYSLELKEQPIEEYVKNIGSIPGKCISEKLCSFFGCANTRLTENILKH